MRRWFAFGALNGALAIAAGAFAAHGLKARLSPDMLAAFETGARYHLIHALALCAAALAAEHFAPRPARTAAILFAVGILLFSGSLYLLTLTGTRGFGFVTPLGGVAFIAGWLALAWSGLRKG
ncbi:DUF423 domain-containing protein [Rhizomicrobium electricum]|jgi:uncharacterized membrane protein YgdD (TMEM256/DUF423 family)|uniref:DUF423 domain-containing protein n=1 Tax=Rhizomicrobium electricum TaxID=480070 RepID=A0ABN1EF41_9PROT|nr:DUF423 domain-containing protein [Rhizomicrobium electricum]NIJ48607.1 uncharacterized membrane protein YgdD (TMEM256/DUF423 family) [Rhizomicrobium electricum]